MAGATERSNACACANIKTIDRRVASIFQRGVKLCQKEGTHQFSPPEYCRLFSLKKEACNFTCKSAFEHILLYVNLRCINI